MTISFDVIWLPAGLTALMVLWALVALRDFGSSGFVFEELIFGLIIPAIPVLGAWLIWALLT